MALASGPQLWRLNREGRLQLRDEPAPDSERVDAATAHAVIQGIVSGDGGTSGGTDSAAISQRSQS